MSGFIRLLRRIVGALLLVVSLTYQNSMHTDASGVTKELRLGAWFSPWFTRTETTKESVVATAEGGSITTSDTKWAVEWTLASWSWPILAAGLALLLWPARKPPAGTSPPPAA